MIADVWTAIVSVPEGVLKAAGAVVGATVATGFYLYGRLRAIRPPADPTGPRAALTETDRELGFTLIRTGTDLTRALNDHSELLRRRRGART